MKGTRILLLASAITALSLTSCAKMHANRNNPETIPAPCAAYSLTLTDVRKGWSDDSTYTFRLMQEEGRAIYSEVTGSDGRTVYFTPREAPLTITEHNTLRLAVTEDVNASSSTDAVDVVREDGGRLYRLEYRRDGSSTVTLWNGDMQNTVRIKVNSRKEIPMTGITMRIDGRDFAMHVQQGYSYNRDYGVTRLPFTFDAGFEDDPTHGCELELSPVPVNATPGALSGKSGGLLDICYDFGELTNSPEGGGIYRWNLLNYDGFRWFGPNDSPAYPPSFCQEILPADLVGRRIWIWDSTASLELAFRKHNEPLIYSGSIKTFLFPY